MAIGCWESGVKRSLNNNIDLVVRLSTGLNRNSVKEVSVPWISDMLIWAHMRTVNWWHLKNKTSSWRVTGRVACLSGLRWCRTLQILRSRIKNLRLLRTWCKIWHLQPCIVTLHVGEILSSRILWEKLHQIRAIRWTMTRWRSTNKYKDLRAEANC